MDAYPDGSTAEGCEKADAKPDVITESLYDKAAAFSSCENGHALEKLGDNVNTTPNNLHHASSQEEEKRIRRGKGSSKKIALTDIRSHGDLDAYLNQLGNRTCRVLKSPTPAAHPDLRCLRSELSELVAVSPYGSDVYKHSQAIVEKLSQS